MRLESARARPSHPSSKSAAPEFTAVTGGSPLLSLGKEEIEARIEPIVGTLFYERTDVAWDPDQSQAVSVSQAIANTSVRVRVDLEGEATGPNTEVDIDCYLTPVFTPVVAAASWDAGLYDCIVANDASIRFSCAAYYDDEGAQPAAVMRPCTERTGRSTAIDRFAFLRRGTCARRAHSRS